MSSLCLLGNIFDLEILFGERSGTFRVHVGDIFKHLMFEECCCETSSVVLMCGSVQGAPGAR